MLWLAGSARKRAWVYFVGVGAGSLAGLLAGSSSGLAQTKDLSPAQVVEHRFPVAWHGAAPARPANLFDPNPTYALASADSKSILPRGLLAYADTGGRAPIEAVPVDAVPAEAVAHTVAHQEAATPRPA